MENSLRVAIASRSFSRHPVLREELRRLFARVTFNDAGASLSGEALVSFLSGHDAAITALERMTEDVLARLPELKVLSKYGVGLDTIEIDALRRRNIRLGWTGGVNKRSVSELVLSSAIALLRHVPRARDEVRAGMWRQLQGRQITGRSVGIVGCGHVGKDLTVLLRAFDCSVIVHDVLDLSEFCRKSGARQGGLDTLLAESDIVTLHLPLDACTKNILSRERLASMRPGAILINAARGGLVDEKALFEMLKSDHIAGAALDVFEKEPPENRDLLTLPNVLALPHIGGSSEEAVLAMGRAAIAGLSSARVPDDTWPL